MIEHAVREGLKVWLALPLPRPRQAEEQFMATSELQSKIRDTLRNVEKRAKVSSFLEYLGFRQALLDSHILAMPGKIHILDDYEGVAISPDSELVVPEDSLSSGTTADTYKNVFPLKWLSAQSEYEFQIAMAIELLRSVYRREDLSGPKRVFGLIAAVLLFQSTMLK